MTSKAEQERRRLQSQDLEGFKNELLTGSDRATAVLGTAFLDDQLRQLLDSFFVDVSAARLLLNGPLYSFAKRIKVSYCLGLITRTEFALLLCIRDIRNAVAHGLHGAAFDDLDMAKKFTELKSYLPVQAANLETPFKVFMTAAFSARLGLSRSLTNSLQMPRRTVPD